MPFIQFQLRRDTASLWSSNNPTLASGEMGIETDTSSFKIGNGTTPWNSLAYGGLQGATGETGGISFAGATGAFLYYDGSAVTGSSGISYGGGALLQAGENFIDLDRAGSGNIVISSIGAVTVGDFDGAFAVIDDLYGNIYLSTADIPPGLSGPGYDIILNPGRAVRIGDESYSYGTGSSYSFDGGNSELMVDMIHSLSGASGTDGQVLGVSGGKISWVAQSGGISFSGATGSVLYYGGSSVTGSSLFTFDPASGPTGELTIAGKLTVLGGIDPLYLNLVPTSTNPLPGTTGTLWVNSTGNLQYDNTQVTVGGGFGGVDLTTLDPIAIGLQAGQTGQEQYAVAIGVEAGETGQKDSAIAIGMQAGQTDQTLGAIAIGRRAGLTGQGEKAVAIGLDAGNTQQGLNAVALGNLAGYKYQGGNAVAIGSNAGNTGQQGNAVAIGLSAGYTSQQSNAVAVGTLAGYTGQQGNAVSIGRSAGQGNQGQNAIAIGYRAGVTGQATQAIAIGLSAGYTSQQSNAVAIGSNAGNTGQQLSAVAIGNSAGYTDQQSNAVAIGTLAGYTGQQDNAVAIGYQAGSTGQGEYAVAIGLGAGLGGQGEYAVAIGYQAGYTGQQSNSVAIGTIAGYTGQQGYAIAIGNSAGYTGQQSNAVAIGTGAGSTDQQANAVAIGNFAGFNLQAANTIILNASGVAVDGVPGQTGSFYVAPVRGATSSYVLGYDPGTFEITYDVPAAGGPTGDAATVSVGTVTTLPAGSTVTVTNSGTSYASILDFGIPQGDTGGISFSGPVGSVLYYDGSSVTGSSFFTFDATTGATGEVTIAGKLTVLGGIDPLYLQLVPTSTNPFPGVTGTLWVDTAGKLQYDNAEVTVTGSVGISFSGETGAFLYYDGSGVTGTPGLTYDALNSNIYLPDTTTIVAPGSPLQFQGGLVVQNDLRLNAFLLDGLGAQGTAGQVLASTEDGTQWIDVTGGVDLTTLNPIAIGASAGYTEQSANAIAIGFSAGYTGQESSTIAIGLNAGYTGQKVSAIAIGGEAGALNQQNAAIAIGNQAGQLTQGLDAIAIGNGAGYTGQESLTVAIGYQAANGFQQSQAVAIGYLAGAAYQQTDAVAIGTQAGFTGQGGSAVAIGSHAGSNSQLGYAIAIGEYAGNTGQQDYAIAIGKNAGETNQQPSAVAIGSGAGSENQGTSSIAIGYLAGGLNQAENSIILNASGSAVNGGQTGAFYVAPVRGATSSYVLGYDPVTFEVTYDTPGAAVEAPTSICATAYSTGGQTFAPGTSTNLQYDVAQFEYGITVSTGVAGYFEVPSAGVYKIIPSLQLNPSGNGHIHVWLKVNGVNVENTGTYLAFKNGDYQVFTTEILLELNANDQVQVWAQTSTAQCDLVCISAGGAPPDDYPAAPGIIINMYKLRDVPLVPS